MDITNFKKNHPKNAVGYLLALQADGETEELFRHCVIKSLDDSRQDAIGLGFVRKCSDSYQPTEQGYESIRTIVYHHDSIRSALEAIEMQSGRSARFIDELPIMGVVTRQALLTYEPTNVLIHTLDALADQGEREPSLATVAKKVARNHPLLALELFITQDCRDDMYGDRVEDIDLQKFEDGRIYWTHTTFQYKAMLYHTGILTTRGNDTKSELDPESSVWALEDPL